MQEGWQAGRVNSVLLLTDGADAGQKAGDIKLDELLAELDAAKSVDRPVQVIVVGVGDAVDRSPAGADHPADRRRRLHRRGPGPDRRGLPGGALPAHEHDALTRPGPAGSGRAGCRVRTGECRLSVRRRGFSGPRGGR
ncbi:hypothetical protein GCM10020358_36310 [Amorphoplanes nipponensis]